MDILDRTRPITMAVTQPKYSFGALPNHYELAPRGRLAWLQRILWRALHKMGALKPGTAEVVTYKTVTIDAGQIADQICRAEFELWGRPSKPPERILIGPREMAELARDVTWADYNMHSAPTIIDTYRGMTIEVIPHMQGVLVL